MIAKVVKKLIFRIKSRNILGGIGPGPFSNPNSRGKHKISSKKVKVEVHSVSNQKVVGFIVNKNAKSQSGTAF